MTKPKAIFNWSGGKDSSLALHKILQNGEYEIPYLVTSISEKYNRISMHGVRAELLEQQAHSIGIPLHKLVMPDWPTMETYNQMMSDALYNFKQENIHHAVFGDIFLADLRKYREEQLALADFKGVFPLWQLSTKQLAKEFIDLAFKAIIICVDEKHLDQSFAGREFDQHFLNDLPEKIDPCGEYGEFHTFVYDGPIFQKSLQFTKGETVYRKYVPQPKKENDTGYACGTNTHPTTGFWYCDLISASEKTLQSKI
ncbi:MAG: diphthine--ammonia ligase [Candidatus Aenigmarchaeota archaeon]|nr:diphthine--ammonia ligase [Candidatus Aenigmarchaeota archaeon]